MTNNLPKSAALLNHEADNASAVAFEKQSGMPVDTVPVIADPAPRSTHFIEKPILPPAKSDDEFLEEFYEETGFMQTREVGNVATDNVVEVDFTEPAQEHVVA